MSPKNPGDRRALAASDFHVFIYCDDPSHAKRVAVTNFVRTRGGWHEVPATRANASGYTGTGRTIVGDELPPAGWVNEPLPDGAEIRGRHELVCRKCKRRPVPLRADRRDRVLDRLAGAGVSAVSLSGLAAILNALSTEVDDPESRQG